MLSPVRPRAMAAEFENGENSMGGDAGSGDGGKVPAVLEVEGGNEEDTESDFSVSEEFPSKQAQNRKR